jgi:hypothetical protein
LRAALLLTLPRIAAEQGKIAFISNRDGNFEIYVMNPDGSNQASSSELLHRILKGIIWKYSFCDFCEFSRLFFIATAKLKKVF